MKSKEIIARRVALEFKDGDVINLGFGIPNASADYIPEGVNVILQAENDALRFGETPTKENYNANLANSGGAPTTLLQEHLYLTFKRRLPLFVEATLMLQF